MNISLYKNIYKSKKILFYSARFIAKYIMLHETYIQIFEYLKYMVYKEEQWRKNDK